MTYKSFTPSQPAGEVGQEAYKFSPPVEFWKNCVNIAPRWSTLKKAKAKAVKISGL